MISVTLLIIISCGLLSYLAFNNPAMFHQLKHWPYEEVRSKEYFRLLTSGFIHADWMHLFINMYILWMFGEWIENVYITLFGELRGRLFYLLLFLLTVVFSSLPTLAKYKDEIHYAAVGASGGVSGILFVSILIAPWTPLYLFFIIPIPGIILGVLYLVYSSWAAKNRNDNIGHEAHFYGAIFGVLFTIALKPALFNSFLNKLVQLPF